MHQVETTFSQSVASSGRPWHFFVQSAAADPTMIHPTTRQRPLNSRRRGDHKIIQSADTAADAPRVLSGFAQDHLDPARARRDELSRVARTPPLDEADPHRVRIRGSIGRLRLTPCHLQDLRLDPVVDLHGVTRLEFVYC